MKKLLRNKSLGSFHPAPENGPGPQKKLGAFFVFTSRVESPKNPSSRICPTFLDENPKNIFKCFSTCEMAIFRPHSPFQTIVGSMTISFLEWNCTLRSPMQTGGTHAIFPLKPTTPNSSFIGVNNTSLTMVFPWHHDVLKFHTNLQTGSLSIMNGSKYPYK